MQTERESLLELASRVSSLDEMAWFLSNTLLSHREVSDIENDETLPYLSALSGVLESEIRRGDLQKLGYADFCRLLVIALFYE